MLAAAAAFASVEGWTPDAAAYFAITTAGAVGYGDVAPATPAGKLMAMSYMVASVAAFAAALGTAHHTLRSWMRDHLGIRDADPRKQKRA